jgi:hypothetical protein
MLVQFTYERERERERERESLTHSLIEQRNET